MAIEIERKFLVKKIPLNSLGVGSNCSQGYLASGGQSVVRVRTIAGKGYLTIKSQTSGISRAEYEYEIPFAEACEMLDNLCAKPLIKKTRYRVVFAGQTWEIDEFHDDNAGLIVAEIELTSESQTFELPDWVAEEVTGDCRYYNSNLSKNPFKNWK